MDQKATEAAGYDKGFDNGLETGIKQGETNKTLELAQKLKAEGVDINIICKTTGLSIDEINNL